MSRDQIVANKPDWPFASESMAWYGQFPRPVKQHRLWRFSVLEHRIQLGIFPRSLWETRSTPRAR
jgi:hypothetical protein